MHTTERPVVRTGASVYASDGTGIGNVKEANAGYIVVGESTVFSSDYFVPTLAVVRATDGRVDPNVSTTEALASGWDRGQAIPT